jgi:hypothetical protein
VNDPTIADLIWYDSEPIRVLQPDK